MRKGLVYGVLIIVVSMLVKNVFVLFCCVVSFDLIFCIDVLSLNMLSNYRLMINMIRMSVVIRIGFCS